MCCRSRLIKTTIHCISLYRCYLHSTNPKNTKYMWKIIKIQHHSTKKAHRSLYVTYNYVRHDVWSQFKSVKIRQHRTIVAPTRFWKTTNIFSMRSGCCCCFFFKSWRHIWWNMLCVGCWLAVLKSWFELTRPTPSAWFVWYCVSLFVCLQTMYISSQGTLSHAHFPMK